jgi:hypothetical protein
MPVKASRSRADNSKETGADTYVKQTETPNEPPNGWDYEEAARRAPDRALVAAQARRERVRDGDIDPDVEGCVEYARRLFVSFDDAEQWLEWQLAQWPEVAQPNGDVFVAMGFIDEVSLGERAWPGAEPVWNETGRVSEAYG